MATPTQLHALHGDGAASSPGTAGSPTRPRTVLRPRLRSERQPVPGPGPALPPAPGRRDLEPRRRRLQRLPPEARPRRRRPVPRRPQLQDAAGVHRRPARDHLLPGGRDRGRGAATSAAAEQASPELPGLEPDRDHQRRRRPRLPPVPRGRQDVPGGAVQRRAPVAWPRSRRRSPAPTTTASSSSGSPCTSTRSRPRSRPSPTRFRRSSAAIPIRMRSIQVNIDRENFTINPTNCSPLLGRLAGNRRPGHGDRLLLLLPRGQLRRSRLQAQDDDPPAGGPEEHPPRRQPGTAVRSDHAAGRRQHQIARR